MAEWETTVTRPDGGGGNERVAVTVDEPARTHPRLHRHAPWWAGEEPVPAETVAPESAPAPAPASDLVSVQQ